MKLAVISDLHAHEATGPRRSSDAGYYTIGGRETANYHPMESLIEHVRTKRLTADYLLCAGDMGDRGNPVGLRKAWADAHRLAKQLSAHAVYAATGNHDVDSRHTYNDHDAKGALQQLEPTYPCNDDPESDHYWSKNFVLLTHGELALVLLNSAAYHGEVKREWSHGRISKATISKLKSALRRVTSSCKARVLLCHHHPQQHPNLAEDDDYEVMKGGVLLVDLLARDANAPWLIIHGHKHYPRLVYASGGATSPVILSSGSLAGYTDGSQGISNQFHQIEVNSTGSGSAGLWGKVHTWTWHYGLGWKDPGSHATLPSVAGFGHRGDPSILGTRILEACAAPNMPWRELVAAVPEVENLIPDDWSTLVAYLNAKGRNLAYDDAGRPLSIGVP
ncbi:MAG: metallophosphoesterase [Fimbriimonadaceae bacterium]|nr:metallophosphoesterase [Fimbriimonadaceae bacterium]